MLHKKIGNFLFKSASQSKLLTSFREAQNSINQERVNIILFITSMANEGKRLYSLQLKVTSLRNNYQSKLSYGEAMIIRKYLKGN